MDTRFYTVREQQINIESVANNIVNSYQAQGYKAQAIGNQDHVLVQLKKGSDLEALVGLQATLTLSLQRTSGGVVVTVGQRKWIDKAAVGAVGLVFAAALWPLAITAGAGAIRQANLTGQVLALLDALVLQQYPEVQINPVLSGTFQS
jgi:hypothetical protein